MTVENSAKAVILHGGRVLLVRYEDTSFGLGTWYSLPGGRQHYGENLSQALERECVEEVGVKVSVGALLYVREYIHANHRLRGVGRDQHKVEFMFRCTLLSDPLTAHVVDEDQTGVEWVELSRLESVNVFPTPLRELGKLLGSEGDASVYWGDVF